MSKEILIQFMGFECKETVREYFFEVREPESAPREFTIDITNEAFIGHRARFQDAPSICSRKLRSELAANGNHPPESHFQITDAELQEYRGGRADLERNRSPRKLA